MARAVLLSLAARHAFQQRQPLRAALSKTPWRVPVLHRRLQQSYAVYPSPEPQQPPPPRRSLPSRMFRAMLLYSTFGSACILAGFGLSVALLPTAPSLSTLLTKAPTDAQTLEYAPVDASAAAINAAIVSHPLCEALRRDPRMRESRPHLKVPAWVRHTSLTAGTLAGPGRIAVPPLMFTDADGRELVSVFYLGEQLCGHPGFVHGGMLATLLDEWLARCCFAALPNRVAVTANLKIDYKAPVKADAYYVLRARTVKVDGRKAWVTGWIEPLGEGVEEAPRREDGPGPDCRVRCVEASALYIEPRNAKIMKRIYTPDS